MGGTSSKANFEKYSSQDLGITQDTYNTINSKCQSKVSARNIVDIIGSTGVKLNSNQENEIQNLCMLKETLGVKKDAAAQAKLLNDLEAKTKATGGFPAANTEINQKITNKVKASISQNEYNNVRKDCIADLNADNIIRIVGSQDVDANISQVNAAYNECIQEFALDNEIISKAELEDITKSKVSAEAAGYDPIGAIGDAIASVFSSFTGPMMIGLVVSGIVLIVALFLGPQLLGAAGDFKKAPVGK